MRDPNRIEPILDALYQLWATNPDWRLTQLVVNAARTGVPCSELYSLEDDVFLERLTALTHRYANPDAPVITPHLSADGSQPRRGGGR
jgi:uncharacterized protein YihD (DUF1040 family)